MKLTTMRSTLVAFLLPLAGLIAVTTTSPANAQQRPNYPNLASLWAGGNHTPQPGQTKPQIVNPTASPNKNARYNVVPIGVLPGKTASFLTVVRGANNREHVVGYSYVYKDSLFLTAQGFLWQNGKLKALPLLDGWPAAFAFGINDHDQVVGAANNINPHGGIILQTAVLWDHGLPVNLGALQPGWNAIASDVNVDGVVVGQSAPTSGQNAGHPLPVVWSGGVVHALPLLPGAISGGAEEINAQGVIVGSQTSTLGTVSCRWYPGGTGYTAVAIGGLGGSTSQAFGINNHGHVVGLSLLSGNIYVRGYFWDEGQGLNALSPLPGSADDIAFNINNSDQIVGESAVTDSSGHVTSWQAALWENGAVLDLQTLVPSGTPPLNYKMGNINDLGEITVDATNADGSPLALLLVPKRN